MSAPPARVVAVCADDVGLIDGAAETAIDLAALGRLNAASCVVNAPGWPDAASRLAHAPASLALGLHLNLTEGVPLGAEMHRAWPSLPGIAHLLGAAFLRTLPLAAIAAEVRAQLAAFTLALGRPPAFVDGHQHVHALPGVREIVLDAIAAQPAPVAVRSTARLSDAGGALKPRVIEASGGRALERALRARRVAHNRVLLGAYAFTRHDYRGLVQRWLAAAPAEGALLFCHPCAGAVDGPHDPIAAARRREAAYLGSDAFADDLAAAGATIGSAWAERD